MGNKKAEENIQKRKKAQRDKRLEENYKKHKEFSCLIGVLAERSRENWTRAKFEDLVAENFQK